MTGELNIPLDIDPNGNNSPKDKGEKTEVNNNFEEDLETADVLDISSTNPDEIKNENQALTLINGIYGYINEYNSSGVATGNKVWLSLTPYEIAPRLADINLFRPSNNDIDNQIGFSEIINPGEKSEIINPGEKKGKKYSDLEEKNIRKKTINVNLSKAMTVGNRLQASRIVTNYLTEILNPRLDTRFGSKEQRVGQASRFLDSETGDEADRSAFLHIVPDLELSNGRIAIPFGVESKEKTDPTTGQRKIKSYRTAFVPVNFNFVHSNYTLTIKEFLLNNVSEQNREIYSLDKTFDGNVLRFFGSHPKIISLGGVLSNFDDDVIGLEKLFGQMTGATQTVTWLGQSGTGSQTAEISSRGSMRDTFLSYYNNFLKGTKAKDYGLKIYLYYNWRIIEGYILDLNVQTSGENDNVMYFNANMVVKSESTVYEQGVGLGKSVPQNYYSRRFGAYGKTIDGGKTDPFELDSVFASENMLYRREFRNYAIQSTINALKVGQGITKNKDFPGDIYTQLLYSDDPYLPRLDTQSEIKVTEIGHKLEEPITDPKVKTLINLYLYRLIVKAWMYNRELDQAKVKRTSDTLALLNNFNSTINYPHPTENSFNLWLTDTTENKEGNYYTQLWDAFKQTNIKTFIQSFIKGLSVDGQDFRLSGPVGSENITASSAFFTNFMDFLLVYIYDEWINTNGEYKFVGDYKAVADLSLSSAMGYKRDIKDLLK